MVCVMAMLTPGIAMAQSDGGKKKKAKTAQTTAKKQQKTTETIEQRKLTKTIDESAVEMMDTVSIAPQPVPLKEEVSPIVIVEEETVEITDEPIYVAVDKSAEFPGGQAALMRWIGQNIRYPEAAHNKEVQGRVMVKMVLKKDGSVGECTVVTSVDPDLDAEALRLVRRMPRWQPAIIDGEPVASYITLPITFRLTQR